MEESPTMAMTLSDFDYDLPEELVAQHPVSPRDASRLLVVKDGLSDRVFRDLPGLLPSHSLIVFNDTRVFPARLEAHRQSGGRVEVFLVHPLSERKQQEDGWQEVWDVLCRPAKRLRPGEQLLLPDREIRAEVLSKTEEGSVVMRFSGPGRGDMFQVSERIGAVPLPPYIKRRAEQRDRETYQTVFARNNGAVAAPTAGLHFTEELLDQLAKIGHEFAWVTLHVGPGTFRPVQTDNLDDHVMHSERYEISEETAARIRAAKKDGRALVAVGTTVVRVLESCVGRGGLAAGSGWTDLFIRPGFQFHLVDAMVTNFHLPRSTLLMLVSAFAGRKRVLEAYRHAVENRYRFYSYGDAMLLFPG